MKRGETCWAKGQKSLSSRLSAGTLYGKRRLMWMDARWVTGTLRSPACFLQTSHLPCPPSAHCPPGLHGPCVSSRHSGGCGDSPRLEEPAVRPSLWETIQTAYLSLSGPLCQVAPGAPQQRDAGLPIKLERALRHLQWGRDEVSTAGREEHHPEGRMPQLALSPMGSGALDKPFCFPEPGPSLWNALAQPTELKMAVLPYQPWAVTFLVFKVKAKSLSHVQLFATPWTVAYQAPQSMEFSRQEYWSGLPFPPLGDLPDPGIEPGSPELQADALPSEPPRKPS